MVECTPLTHTHTQASAPCTHLGGARAGTGGKAPVSTGLANGVGVPDLDPGGRLGGVECNRVACAAGRVRAELPRQRRPRPPGKDGFEEAADARDDLKIGGAVSVAVFRFSDFGNAKKQ